MSARVLIVEDENDLAEPLRHFLQARGLACEVAGTGEAALAAAARERPDLVLLDLMLPGLSGFEVCRRLRAEAATADVPILVVTARTDEFDKVVGFEAGADDYVTKPYSLRELSLRVQALLRRSTTRPSAAPPAGPAAGPPTLLRFAELTIDPVGHHATSDGRPLDLTVVEFRMLVTFLERRGEALDRDAICLGTWGDAYAISERAVDTNVKRLRRKLGDAGRYLETVRGVGYRWVASPEGATG